MSATDAPEPVWVGSSRSPGYGIEVARIAAGAYAIRNPRTGKVMMIEADQWRDFAVRLRLYEDLPDSESGFNVDAALRAMNIQGRATDRDDVTPAGG